MSKNTGTGRGAGKGTRAWCPVCSRPTTQHTDSCPSVQRRGLEHMTALDAAAPALNEQMASGRPKVVVLPRSWTPEQMDALFETLNERVHGDVILLRDEPGLKLVGFDVVWPPPVRVATYSAEMQEEDRARLREQIENLHPAPIQVSGGGPTTSAHVRLTVTGGNSSHSEADIRVFDPPPGWRYDMLRDAWANEGARDGKGVRIDVNSVADERELLRRMADELGYTICYTNHGFRWEYDLTRSRAFESEEQACRDACEDWSRTYNTIYSE